jgi:hypothetical protein
MPSRQKLCPYGCPSATKPVASTWLRWAWSTLAASCG